KQQQFANIVKSDPAIESIVSFNGGGGRGGGGARNTGRMFAGLKPMSERKATVDEVIARLRKKLAVIPGATLYLQAVQDVRMGARSSNAQYQYTLQDADLNELDEWGPKLLAKLRAMPELRDV